MAAAKVPWKGSPFRFNGTFTNRIGILTRYLIGLKYTLGSVFVSRSQTVWTMFGGVVSITVNIALNIVFQRKGMGIEGVALATILAQVAVLTMSPRF